MYWKCCVHPWPVWGKKHIPQNMPESLRAKLRLPLQRLLLLRSNPIALCGIYWFDRQECQQSNIYNIIFFFKDETNDKRWKNASFVDISTAYYVATLCVCLCVRTRVCVVIGFPS